MDDCPFSGKCYLKNIPVPDMKKRACSLHPLGKHKNMRVYKVVYI